MMSKSETKNAITDALITLAPQSGPMDQYSTVSCERPKLSATAIATLDAS